MTPVSAEIRRLGRALRRRERLQEQARERNARIKRSYAYFLQQAKELRRAWDLLNENQPDLAALVLDRYHDRCNWYLPKIQHDLRALKARGR
jgi:23S rRNA G2069 N7-methylase RlmK/C1962 C5-methylase RlmI